jgi:hypothetical protein
MMEQKLQVQLPTAYAAAVVPYPWPELANSTEYSLWDDAALNVERTFEYRAGYGGAPPWPLHYVHIGDDDDACPYALHCSDGTIIKTDHGNLTKAPLDAFPDARAFVLSLQDPSRGASTKPCSIPGDPDTE